MLISIRQTKKGLPLRHDAQTSQPRISAQKFGYNMILIILLYVINHMFLRFNRRETCPCINPLASTFDSNAIDHGNFIKVLIQHVFYQRQVPFCSFHAIIPRIHLPTMIYCRSLSFASVLVNVENLNRVPNTV